MAPRVRQRRRSGSSGVRDRRGHIDSGLITVAVPVGWSDPEPAEVRRLDAPQAWDQLERDFGAYNAAPLARCLAVAQKAGARSLVIERGYVDLDYRSEFAAFHAKAFSVFPSVVVRLHFFATELDPDKLWDLSAAQREQYVGYLVLRPSKVGRVGRTMLTPPPELSDAVRTAVPETVHFFGQDLSVSAVPFVEQDRQVGRCAHAAAWICQYSGFRRGETARQPMAAFTLSANPALSEARGLPSGGLSVTQIVELMRVFGLPAVPYSRTRLPSSTYTHLGPTTGIAAPVFDESGAFVQIACRYLNSGFPVLVATKDHAFTLCGYRREANAHGAETITFLKQDDQAGPYRESDPVDEWKALVAPLPEKLWLPAEAAEARGAEWLISLARSAATESEGANRFVAKYEAGDITFRTYASTSVRFKREVEGRLERSLVEEYRMLRMPRFVWVVEAVDRGLRGTQKNCVVGEVVLDATSNEWAPTWLARHIPVLAIFSRGDGSRVVKCGSEPYQSGGSGPP